MCQLIVLIFGSQLTFRMEVSIEPFLVVPLRSRRSPKLPVEMIFPRTGIYPCSPPRLGWPQEWDPFFCRDARAGCKQMRSFCLFAFINL